MKEYIFAVQIPASFCGPKFDPDCLVGILSIFSSKPTIANSSMIRYGVVSHAARPPKRTSVLLFLSSLMNQVEDLHQVGSLSCSILLRRFASLGVMRLFSNEDSP